MIINGETNDVLVIGQDTSKKAGISANKTAKLQYLLTKGLYKDPITATIAEWTNNGIDAVVDAGKDPIQNPVMVKIEKPVGSNQWTFSVEDKGIGLDDRDFEEICMEYLESTKEGRNDQIGHFGIGMKAFLALDRPATFTCRKNGIERKYMVYEGEEFVKYDLVYEKPTTEESGVKAEIIIKDYNERNSFILKAKTKLSYYDTAVLVVDGSPHISKIHRNDLFQFTEGSSFGNIHLTLKDVYYPIDWEALGIYNINIPIALRFGLGDGLQPTPSRESYITNDKTKKLILDRIEKVADWFVTEYNKTVLEAKTLIEAYPYIDITYRNVTIQNHQFTINNIETYSSIPIKKVQVDGISLRDSSYYKRKLSSMFTNYRIVAVCNNGIFKTSKLWGHNIHSKVVNNETVLQVDSVPVGYFREFLKTKYPKATYIKKEGEVELGKARHWADECYIHFLGLTTIEKHLWRDYIKEFQLVRQCFLDYIVDARPLADTDEFKQWIEDKKTAKKLQAASKIRSSSYSGLNKQAGDVTLAYAEKGYYGQYTWKKRAFSIDKLKDNRYLTVLMTADEKKQFAKLPEISASKTTRFAVVGSLEIKKIPNHYQFITLKKFMSDSKVFRRLASAIAFNKACQAYEKIIKAESEIARHCLSKFKYHKEILQRYVTDNLIGTANPTFYEAILAVATENDLFDKSIWDVYTTFLAELEKYEFVKFLVQTEHLFPSDIKKYNRLINQQLLFRKKYYNDLPEEVEMVIKEKEEETV